MLPFALCFIYFLGTKTDEFGTNLKTSEGRVHIGQTALKRQCVFSVLIHLAPVRVDAAGILMCVPWSVFGMQFGLAATRWLIMRALLLMHMKGTCESFRFPIGGCFELLRCCIMVDYKAIKWCDLYGYNMNEMPFQKPLLDFFFWCSVCFLIPYFALAAVSRES